MYNSTTYNTSNSFSKIKGGITVDAETILGKSFSRYDNTRSIYCCVEYNEYYKNTKKMKTKCSTSAISALFPPKFIQLQELNRANDAEGNTSLLLKCTSDVSIPVSKIRWNITSDFKYESFQEKDKVEELSGHIRTEILSANLTRHNNGESLSCYIENHAFPEIKVFKTYELNITYKPFISFTPSSPVTTYVDDSFTVLCQCDANPPAKIEWSNTSSNEIGKRTEYSLELIMQFHSTGRHNFSCNAKNTIGSAESAVRILVKDQPLSTSGAPTCSCNDLSSSTLIGIICGGLAVLIVVVVIVGFVVVSKIRQNTQRSEEYADLHFQEQNLYMQPLGPVHVTSDGSQSPDGQQTQTYESLE
ncbi:sialic acid-binding Ig-like lectin 7 [Mya arenaria]|uniref:sialic acid-binding Ig-like lectin 7 n=1 Tax=Mya arenaria TaxID=6604 RepID=UPI0022E2F550|nr:sialic acid-binding Ig-like lectin 7 [Mya arenaria]